MVVEPDVVAFAFAHLAEKPAFLVRQRAETVVVDFAEDGIEALFVLGVAAGTIGAGGRVGPADHRVTPPAAQSPELDRKIPIESVPVPA